MRDASVDESAIYNCDSLREGLVLFDADKPQKRRKNKPQLSIDHQQYFGII